MDESQQLVDIGDCWLQDEASNSILAVVKAHLPSLQQKVRARVPRLYC